MADGGWFVIHCGVRICPSQSASQRMRTPQWGHGGDDKAATPQPEEDCWHSLDSIGAFSRLCYNRPMPERILVVEDDTRMSDMLQRGLRFEGYEVEAAADGVAALKAARDQLPDVVVLDLMLPGELDGLEVCRRLRSGSSVPILMLTARGTLQDKVAGLDSGADDYLVKADLHFEELLARIRALLRRRQPAQHQEELRFADLVVLPANREAMRGERWLELTAKEFDFLEMFMRNPRQVLTRDMIYERIWDYDFGGESNIIEVYVRYLRTKLEANGEPRLLHTVRGVGYVLREQ